MSGQWSIRPQLLVPSNKPDGEGAQGNGEDSTDEQQILYGHLIRIQFISRSRYPRIWILDGVYAVQNCISTRMYSCELVAV